MMERFNENNWRKTRDEAIMAVFDTPNQDSPVGTDVWGNGGIVQR
jgi:hypothetical protein